MANTRILQRSFGGGEISPEMLGRIDDVKYQTGLSLCRNFIVKPQGPVKNRPGFQFVREVKDSSKEVRLIPFTYSVTQTMIIEVGEGYFRFHTAGATLLYGDAPYEIASPYTEADIFDLAFVQSADVLTITHENYAPRELRRLGATYWELNEIEFSGDISAPTGVTATPNAIDEGDEDPYDDYNYSYVVTSIGSDNVSESSASAIAECTNNLYSTGRINTISWDAVSGASRYNVYKLSGGLYGFIGQTDGTSIEDENISADLSMTPPIYDNVFDGDGDYPAAVSYFEQRRCFAGTYNSPQNMWMTRSGTESDMSYCLPTRDDDRISFRVAAREANSIRHIVPLSQLLMLTSSAEWRVTSINSDAITPTTISVRPQSYVGASRVQPVIVNNTTIYEAARGGHIYELAYNWQASGFITGDLSLRSAHLFDGYSLKSMAYSKAPQPIVWMVSTSGKLIGLTYVPEHQIGAWHQHDTEGAFEACAVVAEEKEDMLYVVVKREINGSTVRYIERMNTQHFGDKEDAFFVDSGLTYDGVPADEISGLDHLEGETVSILADGAVHPQRVVTGGAISLDIEASKIHIGLPITADIKTNPIAIQTQDGSFGQGRVKNVNKLWVRCYRSSGIFAGPDTDHLTEVKQRTTEPYGSAPELKSEEIPLMMSPSWGSTGQVAIRQADPLPLTIVSISAEVSIGS